MIITDGMRHALTAMRPGREVTTGEISLKSGIPSGHATRKIMARLLKAGLVERTYHSIGGNTHSRWVMND